VKDQPEEACGIKTNDDEPLHRKKNFFDTPSPAGMKLTKLSLCGNNLYLTSLFPPRESLVSDILAGDRNIEKTGISKSFVYGVPQLP
jgi:hypothetical protein